MARQQSDLRPCRAVRAKLVGHQHSGGETLFLEQLTHQFHGCSLVAPSLHQQVENLTSSSTARHSRNCRPAIIAAISSRCHSTLAEGVDGEVLERTMARTSTPTVARFVGYIEPTLSEQIFDVAIAEHETHIQPNGVPDDRRRKLVAGKRDRHRHHTRKPRRATVAVTEPQRSSPSILTSVPDHSRNSTRSPL